MVTELHRRQGEMYAGGSSDRVVELLAEDIVWHVPGTSSIAGDHRGPAQVIEYMDKRRRLASATMQMHLSDALSQGDAVIAQSVDGSAVLDGEQITWKTVGVYRVDIENRQILEEAPRRCCCVAAWVHPGAECGANAALARAQPG